MRKAIFAIISLYAAAFAVVYGMLWVRNQKHGDWILLSIVGVLVTIVLFIIYYNENYIYNKNYKDDEKKRE